MGDHVTGMTTVAGILARAARARAHRRGQLVETSLLRTGMYCLGWDLGIQLRFGKLARHLAPHRDDEPDGELLPRPATAAGSGCSGSRPTASGRLLPAIDRPDLGDDERFATARDRRHNAGRSSPRSTRCSPRVPATSGPSASTRHDVWWAPVQHRAEVVADPQAIAAGAFVDVPAGDGAPPTAPSPRP